MATEVCSTAGSSKSDPGDIQLLAEMLREGERTLDHQVRAMEELDDKSEHMLTLGVAAIGGGATLATFAIVNAEGALDAYFVTGLLTAGLLNLASVLLFAGSYIGFKRHTEVHIGPRLEWVASKSNDAAWKLLDHFLSVIKDYPSYYDWNTRKMTTSAERRRQGLYLLLASVLFYALAFAYILAMAIGG